MESIKEVYNKKRVFKYSLVNNSEYLYFIENDLIELFGMDYIDENMHQVDESVIFLRASVEQHEKVREILSEENIFNFFTEELNLDTLFEIEDITDNIFDNIQKFEGLENFNSDINLFTNVYYTMDKDDILDKIIERGIGSLNKHDHNILES